jgi:hypothetical protein
MLLGDIAIAGHALTLWAQEGWISENDSANDIADPARRQGRSHASRRMPQENGGGKSEPSDEARNVARVIVVSISMERRARLPMPPGVRHHHIEVALRERAKGLQQAPFPVNPWSRTNGGPAPPVLR